MNLTERKSRILRIIVDDYVLTAAPVASSVIARTRGLGVSPATVRNEMVALEEDGFILRPHISAGGVPSDKGYRHFVYSLDPERGPESGDALYVGAELGASPDDVDRWADAASSALAALLNTLAFATPPRAESPAIKSIELLRLQEMIAMLVVVLQEATIYRQLISIEKAVTESDLETARNKVNEAVVGKTFQMLESSTPSVTDTLEQRVVLSALEVLRKHEAQATHGRRIQGMARLFAQPELSAKPDQARNVVSAIEDSSAFASLTAEALAGDEPVVLIGRENRQESLHEFSVVMCRYGVQGEVQGVVGLIAPTRMEYGRAIPVIRHTASALSNLASRVYGVV